MTNNKYYKATVHKYASQAYHEAVRGGDPERIENALETLIEARKGLRESHPQFYTTND